MTTNASAEIEVALDLASEKTREKDVIKAHIPSLQDLTLKQRKIEASKPIYLVRYE